MELLLSWRALSTVKEAGESEPSISPPGRQIRLIQIMQMTHSLARITGHSTRRKEREWQRWSGRVREIRTGGGRRIQWATEEWKRWRRNES